MTQFNVYIPGTTMFAHSSCCLHIPLAHPCLYYYLLSPQYTVLHILFHCTFYPLFFSYFYFILTYIYIYSLVLCFIFIEMFFHCPLSGPVLIYISLLIISCIFEYVMNKRTLTLTLTLSASGSGNMGDLWQDLSPLRNLFTVSRIIGRSTCFYAPHELGMYLVIRIQFRELN